MHDNEYINFEVSTEFQSLPYCQVGRRIVDRYFRRLYTNMEPSICASKKHHLERERVWVMDIFDDRQGDMVSILSSECSLHCVCLRMKVTVSTILSGKHR